MNSFLAFIRESWIWRQAGFLKLLTILNKIPFSIGVAEQSIRLSQILAFSRDFFLSILDSNSLIKASCMYMMLLFHFRGQFTSFDWCYYVQLDETPSKKALGHNQRREKFQWPWEFNIICWEPVKLSCVYLVNVHCSHDERFLCNGSASIVQHYVRIACPCFLCMLTIAWEHVDGFN